VQIIKAFIAAMVGAFVVQLPCYWTSPESNIELNQIVYPEFFTVLLNAFGGAFLLCIVHQMLKVLEKDLMR